MYDAHSQQVFVVAAKIAAELHFAVRQARDLSLTAKNARVISVRAGEQTAGFRAITDYIDMLSRTTIEQASAINEIAVSVSRLSVELARVNELIDKYHFVQSKFSCAAYITSLDPPLKLLADRRDILQQDYSRNKFMLGEAIQEARLQMRSANVIATSSKVEASRAGDFEGPLMVIADNIENTSENIKQHLNRALCQLNY